VINFQENNRAADLEAGTLYSIILEKLPGKLLAQYYRWVKENEKVEFLVILKDWTTEEAEYQIQATELKHGLKSGNSNWKSHETRSKPFGTNQVANKRKGSCTVRGADHANWSYDVFKSTSIQEKWGTAKKLGLCYRCLGDDHLGGECPRSRVCNIDGCRDRYHRLLHGNQSGNLPQFRPQGSQPQSTQHQLTKTNQERREVPPSRNDNALAKRTQEQGSGHTPEGDTNTYSTSLKIQEAEEVVLRTVAVILKHGKKRLLVNCFLDEVGDTTYVNEGVDEEHGVKGKKELIIYQWIREC